LGESRGLGGAEALAALVVGYEAVARLGMAAPGRFHERGWHATAVCGTFAAALAAGRCLGLPAARLAAALGIAGSMASGLLEFLEDGSWVKRLHPGWAAHSGIIAAGLAHGGFTGPATVLDGRFGFYRAALGESPEMDRVLKSLGTDWETLNISFKPYPCCHYNHAYVDAVRSLKARHGLAPDLVEEIQCLVPRGEVPIVCEPIAVKRRPRTDYDAKFSLPFAVAVALLDDHVGIGSFSAERLDDARLLALADRVTYAVDPQSPFPRVFPGSVRVRLRDGRRLEAREEVNRGGPEAPLSEAEILAKFADNASRTLPVGRVAALRDAVLGLEAERDLRRVLSLARIG
jgi:2-methylcitrate dehydratase PrpD